MDYDKIDRVLSGDIEAFRYLIKDHKDMVFNIALSIVKDEQRAEEVSQDSFVSAFKGLKGFKRKSSFKTWLYRITVNHSFQHLKRNEKEVNHLDIQDVPEIHFAHKSENIDHEHESLYSAMSTLPNQESLALNLFYLEDNNLKEIHAITGWSISNIKVILYRARKNLRSKLSVNRS
jgi:RNA polymerase sigma-70 factor (ECF subfamily)